MDDRLYRSRNDRMLAGVAGGLADMWDADPSLVRIIWALLVVFTGGIALVVYIVMAIVVPDEPHGRAPYPGNAGAPADPGTASPSGSGWVAPGSAAFADPGATVEQREARQRARAERRAQRGGLPGGLIAGLVLIAIGLFFLARQFLPRLDFDLFWPVILIGIGVLVLVSSLRRGPRDPGSGS